MLPRDKSENKLTAYPLLDITYPYTGNSMLAKSRFFGFQCLINLVAIHFAIIYLVTNYFGKGYLLKWDVLQMVASNLAWDLLALVMALALALVQIKLADSLILLLKAHKNGYLVIYAFCLLFMALFVVGALFLISQLQLYFTDRIFIVVFSWSFPVKTASYCIDRLRGSTTESLTKRLKFIVSPVIIYKDFLKNHDPSLQIHKSYLLIKLATAGVCLLINYILLTEIIAPYLNPETHGSMTFAELFFRLTLLLFCSHSALYYLTMDNIMLAMAEITQLKSRQFYGDWWNAETISEFLDKWVFMINSFSNTYIRLPPQIKHALHLAIIFTMLFQVFGDRITLTLLMVASGSIALVLFFGANTRVQNNHMVHLMTICYQPLILALTLKYQIFS